MDSLPVTVAVGYKGKATGIAGNAGLTTDLLDVFSCALTGSGKQAYVGPGLVVPVSGTTTLNLLSGLTNPLGEAIAAFGHVYAVIIEHDPASLATAGITVFGGGSDDFQGPFDAGNFATLTPGQGLAFLVNAAMTPWVVDGTHKNIAIVNLDATALHTATVNVAIFGTTA